MISDYLKITSIEMTTSIIEIQSVLNCFLSVYVVFFNFVYFI